MKLWKFAQFKADGSTGREARVYRYITPGRAASYRYRRDYMPVCNCCGERHCGWNIDDLRDWELAALGLARQPVESRKYLREGGFPAPLICHQHGRFYRMARENDLENARSDARAEASINWYGIVLEVEA